MPEAATTINIVFCLVLAALDAEKAALGSSCHRKEESLGSTWRSAHQRRHHWCRYHCIAVAYRNAGSHARPKKWPRERAKEKGPHAFFIAPQPTFFNWHQNRNLVSIPVVLKAATLLFTKEKSVWCRLDTKRGYYSVLTSRVLCSCTPTLQAALVGDATSKAEAAALIYYPSLVSGVDRAMIPLKGSMKNKEYVTGFRSSETLFIVQINLSQIRHFFREAPAASIWPLARDTTFNTAYSVHQLSNYG